MTSLSAYEQQRNANIAANNQRLKELGLIGMRLCASEPAKPPVRATPVKRKLQSPPRTERVLRARSSIKPTLYSNGDDDDRPARRKGKVIIVDDDADEERLVQLGALPDVVLEAEEAGEIVPQRGGAVYVKAMMPSHVSGGYWLQAPPGLMGVMPSVTCDIILRVGSSLWEVRWLLRDKQAGAGLSGGWRGFAVDQRLCVGDSVLFQQRDPSNPRVLDVHVFRKHLLGDEFKAMDAAFELVDALVGEAAVDPSADLPEPSPPTRPALHWHSCRAKPQRRQLPLAVRQHAQEREKAKEHECERYARMALGGGNDNEVPAESPLLLPPPSQPSRTVAVPPPDAPVSPVPVVSPPHSPSPSSDANANAEASMDAAEPVAEPAAELAAAPAAAPAAEPVTASELVVGAVLWGAPLAHGEPHASDFDYFVVTRVPTRLDDNYYLLSYSMHGASTTFSEMRSGKAKLMRRFEPATAAHPRGGVNGAEASRLRAEAERRARGQGGEGRASRSRAS